ncbi:hypothetical protein AcetOrient_orf04821 [Acetobacter orientalis]|uniref:Uncharacterized protein n=1 Tax=Acetobacter orientalis TaxID=146474 RepID=A0A2Z5ZLB6_9PROT|nr:hypothetical protein AcetOrient_orf04821 [Acetobacter orientalis]
MLLRAMLGICPSVGLQKNDIISLMHKYNSWIGVFKII